MPRISLPAIFWPAIVFSVFWPAIVWAAPSVSIKGDDASLVKNLEATLDVRNESCDVDTRRERLILRNLQGRASTAAQAVGFYEANIDIRLIQNGSCWTADIDVQSGRPVVIGELDIVLSGDAAEDPVFLRLIENSPLRQGNILRHNHYQSLRDNLLQVANQRGYFDHRLTRHALEIDPQQRVAHVRLHLDSGPRYRFGEFTLNQDILHNTMAQRYLQFEEGELWSSDALLHTQQALIGSGYFNTARLERGQPDPNSLQLPATLHLSSRRQYAWLAGIGASTDTGPRLRLGFENRYVTDSGHRLRAETEISPVRYGVSSSYEIPLADPMRDRLTFSTGYQSEETNNIDTERLRVGASLITELPRGWVLTRSLDFERERFTAGEQRDVIELLMPGIQVQKIRTSDPIYPRHGWRLGTGVRGTHPSISNTDAFVQQRVWGKGIISLGKLRLLSRLELGHTNVNDVTTLPASVRFFAGGDTSIRGFSYQGIGPVNEDGQVIGGRHMMVGSVEMDYPIKERWGVAAFSDGGNAFNDFSQYDTRVSVGVGVRWRSPLGPIRVDIARPVDADRNWRLHLSMGPDL